MLARRAKRRGEAFDIAPSTADLFRGALADHQAGRLLQAPAAYCRMLTIDPAHADAHLCLGIVLDGLGRSADAEASYHEGRRLRPNYAGVHSNLAFALLLTG